MDFLNTVNKTLNYRKRLQILILSMYFYVTKNTAVARFFFTVKYVKNIKLQENTPNIQQKHVILLYLMVSQLPQN